MAANQDIIANFSVPGLERVREELRKAASAGVDLNKAFSGLTASQRKAQSELDKITPKFSKFHSAVENVTSAMGDLGSILSQTAVYRAFGSTIEKYNKQLYDISRTAKVSGRSFVDLQDGLDQVTQTTKLTRTEAASFFTQLQQGVRGLKMTGTESAELARILSQEFGPSLENVSQAMGELIAIQEKEVGVLRKVRDGFKPGEFTAYVATLREVYDVSEQQIETLIRTERQRALGARGMSESEKQNRALADAMQELRQAGQEFVVKAGKPIADTLTSITKAITPVVSAMGEFASSHPRLVLVGAGFLGVVAAVKALIVPLQAVNRLYKELHTAKGPAGLAGEVADTAGQVANATKGIPGAGGTGAAGFMGRTTSSIGKFVKSPVALGAAGLAAEFGGEYLGKAMGSEKGDRGGQGVKALGGIGGRAMSGAAMGSIGGPWGMAIGAIGGAIFGLIDNFDDVTDALGFTTTAADKAKKALQEEAKAKDVKELAVAGGFEATDADAYGRTVAAAIAREVAMEESKGDKKKAEQITKDIFAGSASESTTTKFQGRLTGDTSKYEKQATELLGEKVALEQKGRLEEEKIRVLQEIQLRNMAVTKAEMQSIVSLLQTRVQAGSQIADFEATINGDLNKSNKLHADNVKHIENQVAAIDKYLNILKGANNARAGQAQQNAAINVLMETQGMSLVQATDAIKEQEGLATAIAKIEAERVGKAKSIYEEHVKIANNYKIQTDLASQQVSIIEAQAELAKAQYLGAAPALELQLANIEAIDQTIASLQNEKRVYQQVLAVNHDNKEAQAALNDLVLKETQLQTKKYQLAKNLREGYIDALQAFTNVEGAFGKIILTQETGLGEIQRQLGAVGSVMKGAVGAGGDKPMMQFQPGGGLQVQDMNQWRENVLKYDPNALTPLAAIANATKAVTDTPGGADFAAAQAMQQQTGIGGMSAATGIDTIAMANRATSGGMGTSAVQQAGQLTSGGAGDLGAPLRTLNDKMSDYVAKGILQAGAMGKGKDSAPATHGDAKNEKKTEEKATQEAKASAKATADAVRDGSKKQIDEQKNIQVQNSKDNREKIDQGKRGDPVKEAMKKHVSQMEKDMKTWMGEFKKNSSDQNMKAMAAANNVGLGVRRRTAGGGPVGPAGADAATAGAAGGKGSLLHPDLVKGMGSAIDKARAAAKRQGGDLNYTGSTSGGGQLGMQFEMTREKTAQEKQKELQNLIAQTRGHVGGAGAEGFIQAEDARLEGISKADRANAERRNMAAGAAQKNAGLWSGEDRGGLNERYEARKERLNQEAAAKLAIQAQSKPPAKASGYVEDEDENRQGGGVAGGGPPPGGNADIGMVVKGFAGPAQAQLAGGVEKGAGAAQERAVVSNAQNLFASGAGSGGGIGGGGGGLFGLGGDLGKEAFGGKSFDDLGKSIFGGLFGGLGKGAFGYAAGGRIPGYGGGDSVPSMLEPGEFVVNKKSAAAYRGLLHSINSNRFAAGGVVPSPELARSGGGGFAPRFAINVRGDSVNRIMASVAHQMSGTLNSMMTPTGTTGRYFDLPRSG